MVSDLDVAKYIGLLFVAVVVLAWLPSGAGRVCRRNGRGRRCAAALTVLLPIVAVPVIALILEHQVSAQPFLGIWWWIAFLFIPAGAATGVSLALQGVGCRHSWGRPSHRGAALLVFFCTLVGLVGSFRCTPDVWAVAHAVSGCGPTQGMMDWWANRRVYHRMYLAPAQFWFEEEPPRCARQLDDRIRQATAAAPSATVTPEPEAGYTSVPARTTPRSP